MTVAGEVRMRRNRAVVRVAAPLPIYRFALNRAKR